MVKTAFSPPSGSTASATGAPRSAAAAATAAPPPTAEQQAILAHASPTRIIDAAAGTGKTTTLALCLARALQRGVVPGRCLLLTKTDAAVWAARDALGRCAVPVVQRAGGNGASSGGSQGAMVQTIEQFARAALERLEGQPVPPSPNREHLADHAWAAMLAAVERMTPLARQGVNIPLNDGRSRSNHWVDAFFDEQARIRGTLTHIDAAGEFVPARDMQEDGDQFTRLNGLVFRAYTQSVRGSNLNGEPPLFRADGDATFDLARYLRQGDVQAQPDIIPRHIAWLLLDEMHDINAACFELISALITANPGCVVVGVGDPDQVIFAQDGARVQYLQSDFLSAAWARPVARCTLSGSFRFGNALSHVINRLLPGKCKSVGAEAATSTAVHFHAQTETPLLQDETLATVLADFKAARPVATQSLAIVLRHPSQLLAIESVLIQQGLPYNLTGFESYFTWPEVNLIRGVLAVAGLRFDQTAGNRQTRRKVIEAFDFFGKPAFSAATLTGFPSRSAYLAQCALQAQDSEAVLVSFFKRFLTNEATDGSQCDPAIAKLFRDGLAAVARAGSAVTVAQVVQYLQLDKLIAHAISSTRAQADARRNASALAAMAQQHGSALDFFTALTALELQADQLHQAAANKIGAGSAATQTRLKTTAKKRNITIYHVDASKGREFSHVYVPQLDRHVFPFGDADAVEERNRLYVAISRAKQVLHLAAHAGQESTLYLALRGQIAL